VFSSRVSFYNNEPTADAGDSAASSFGESHDSSISSSPNYWFVHPPISQL